MVGNSEKLKAGAEHESNPEALTDAANERREQLREHHEQVGEKPKEALEDIQKNAFEKASDIENERELKKKRRPSTERRRDGPIKAERDASYRRTMKQVQSEMSTPARAFSKFIHAKPIEKTSEFVGATVARPNAILSGAIGGFIFTLVIYLTAKHYGYPLSGFESIAGFITGWAVGLLYDYLRLEISGRR